ncbi:MAG: ABC transporter permease [Lachnospiraceae bacterium]|nr:ABC transporter permease [Lachnospiraceae bacterium]
MNHFMELLKINLKLLVRNRGFLFFLLLAPLLSLVILNLKNDASTSYDEGERGIIELEKPQEKIVYQNDWTSYAVKVYDAAQSELAEYVQQELAEAGMIRVFRVDASEMSEADVEEIVKEDATKDRVGASLYLRPEFDEKVTEGDWKEAFRLYETSDDERFELAERVLTEEISVIQRLAQSGQEPKQMVSSIRQMKENFPEKEVVMLESSKEESLTREQENKKQLAGMAYAILSLGFLFCGVCVAYTMIEERDNKVYTRIMLSKVGRTEYLISKFAVAILVSVLQTGVMALYMLLFRNMDFGISRGNLLFMAFLLGMIFNILSLVAGIMVGDVMSANYAVLAIWVVSALLSGCYFSLDGSSKMIQAISDLMPQHWFIKGTEMIMRGDQSVYPMICGITLAYVIVILGIGAVGLKMKESEA